MSFNATALKRLALLSIGGIISTVTYPLTQVISSYSFSAVEMLGVYKVDAVYTIAEEFLLMIIKSSFLKEDKKATGVNLLMVLIMLLGIVLTPVFGLIVVLSIVLNLLIVPYTEYVEEYAVYNKKNIVLINVISCIGITSTILIMLKFDILNGYSAWVRLYLFFFIGQVLFDTIPKIILWKYPITLVHNFDLFNVSWYKEELKGIIDSLRRDTRDIFRAIVKSVTTVGLSSLSGYEVIVSRIILISRVSDPIFNAQVYISKLRRNKIVDTKGETMLTGIDKEISLSIVIVWATIECLVLSFSFGYLGKGIILMLLIHYTVLLGYWLGTFSYYETCLMCYGRGLFISGVYTTKHIVRACSILTGNLYVYLSVLILEYLVQALIVRRVYMKICDKLCKQQYSFGLLGIRRKKLC